MNDRVNWMDWAKFLAVAFVIPVHIPHALGAQPVTWFEVFLLACLMFNAGYLKKERTNLKEEVKKYWYQLGIPYIIYNILFYPYWLIRFYSEHNTMPTLAESLRPIYGALLLQANNHFAEELNPVTWFIAALFIIQLLLDCCLIGETVLSDTFFHKKNWIIITMGFVADYKPTYFAYPYGSEKENGEREYNYIRNSDVKIAFVSYGGLVYTDSQLEQIPRFMLK